MSEVKVETLKKGDEIKIDTEFCEITQFEKSNLGKQGKVKCRIVVKSPKGEQKILIRLAEDTIEKK